MNDDPLLVWLAVQCDRIMQRTPDDTFEDRALEPGAGLLHRFADDAEPPPPRRAPQLRVVK